MTPRNNRYKLWCLRILRLPQYLLRGSIGSSGRIVERLSLWERLSVLAKSTMETAGTHLGNHLRASSRILGTGSSASITSLFGSSNARFIKKLQPKVDAINALEPKFQAMTDEELRGQTAEFRERLGAGRNARRHAGRSLRRLPRSRAAASRHAALRRPADRRHGPARRQHRRNGHRRRQNARRHAAAYLNALEGKGVHVVTVNDYLARRDMEWMGPLYMGLGLTVGAIQSGMESDERQKSYACDITYGTNNEFGFDYLRDNMRPAARGDDRYPKHQQQAQGRCTSRSSTKSTTS